MDRSSRPHRLNKPTPPEVCDRIVELAASALDRQASRFAKGDARLAGDGEPGAGPCRTGAACGTSSLPSRRSATSTRPPADFDPHRHQEARPLRRRGSPRVTGDRQTRNRHVGWEYVHVCIDDASRIAFSQIFPNERKESAVAFLAAALAYYAGLGVTWSLRVMTDKRRLLPLQGLPQSLQERRPEAHLHQALHATDQRQGRALHPDRLARMGLRPSLPKLTNRRAGELPLWLHRYNWHRPHGGIKSQTPISRLGLTEDNLLRLHS